MSKMRDTKSRITRTAWRLFHEKGYEETTIDDIISAAKTSRGSFYHYFAGKDALLGTLPEVFDDYYKEIIETIDPNMNSFDKLIYLSVKVHDRIEREIPMGLLANLYSSQVVTKGDRCLLDRNRYYYRLITQIVDEGQRRGELTSDMPAYDMVHMYSMCERAIVYDYCICDGNMALGEYTQKMLPLLLGALKTRKENDNKDGQSV